MKKLLKSSQSINLVCILMRCQVKLYVAGKVFYEEVEARDYQDAKETALARNPKAKVMGVTAVFG
jgi:hypothetical protein